MPESKRSGFRKLVQRWSLAAFRVLPLPRGQKERIAGWIYFLFGSLFESQAHYENWKRQRVAPPPGYREKESQQEPEVSLGDLVDSICFKEEPDPFVSVIITSCGNPRQTLLCLRSICLYRPAVSFEVIVAVDPSAGESIRLFSGVRGLRVIVLPPDRGFIGSCNAAAASGIGKYLCFIADDARATNSWLDAMLDVFDRYALCGMVGSMLVYPDGRLQGAGAIVWRDGSVENYGYLDDHRKSIYNYLRECDYCSFGSMMIRADLFHNLGGFSEANGSVLCEECDMAFRVREAGFKIYYQPESVVIRRKNVASRTRGDAHESPSLLTNNKFRFIPYSPNFITCKKRTRLTDQLKSTVVTCSQHHHQQRLVVS